MDTEKMSAFNISELLPSVHKPKDGWWDSRTEPVDENGSCTLIAYSEADMHLYGEVCARAAVAALIARNAELEAQTPSALREKLRSCEEALAAAQADAERGRWLVKQAHQKTAYDIYGNGAYWFIGINSDDQRLSFTESLDAARAEAGHG